MRVERFPASRSPSEAPRCRCPRSPRSPTSAVSTNHTAAHRRLHHPVSLTGFQTLRVEDLRLATNFSAKLDQVLQIGQLAETVTVSGQSPLVDVTQASTATLLETEALEMIPSGTNGIVGFLSQVPGAQSNIEVGAARPSPTRTSSSPTGKAMNCGRCSKASMPPRAASASGTTTSSASRKRACRRAATAPRCRSAV